MDTKQLQGNPQEQEAANWMTRLLMQRGFSYGSGSRIELGREELLDYLLSEGVASDRDALAAHVDAAAEVNGELFRRQEIDEDTVFSVVKRDLLEYFAPPPAISRPSAPPRPRKEVIPEPVSASEPEIQAAEVEQQMPPPPPDAGITHTAVSEWAAEDAAAEEAPEGAPEPEESPALVGEELPITTQYKLAILQGLQQKGGSAKAAEIVQMIPTLMNLPEDHRGSYARGPEGKSEEPKYVKYVHSARRFLIQQGELENASRGIWRITAEGKRRLEEAGLLK